MERVSHFYDCSFLPRETQAHFGGPFFRPAVAPFIGNPNVLTSYGLDGTGLRVLTGSITDQFGNEPAQTSDASGPNPDFDGSFFALTA